MFEALKNFLPIRKEVPLNFGKFWAEHGRDISAMQAQVDHIRRKQISVVSQTDEGWTQGAPKPRSDFAYAEKYAHSLWVHVAVRSIASAASMLDLRIYQRDRNGLADLTKEVNQGLAYDLFQKPSLYVTPNELKLSIFSSIGYAGNSYLYIDPEAEELWSLLPQHMHIIADRIDFIENYKFKLPDGSKEYLLPPEQVVHLKNFNSTGYLYGLSPLSACYDQATLTDSDLNFWKQFWKHGGRVMGAWKTDSSLSQVQYERFNTQIVDRYKGMQNMFRDLLLENGVEYEQLGVTQKDANLIEKYKLSRDDILACYGVPSSIAGVLDQANYSNMDVQERLFWQNTILPILTVAEEGLDANTILSEDGKLAFKFDISKVRVLQQLQKDKAEIGKILIESRQYTPNEVRAELWGKEPIAGDGDILGTPHVSNSFFPTQQSAPAKKDAPELNHPKPPRKPYMPKDQKEVFAKAYDDALQKHDKEVLKLVRTRFQGQEKDILESLRKILRDAGSRPIESSDIETLTESLKAGQGEFAASLRGKLAEVSLEFGLRARDQLSAQVKKSVKIKAPNFNPSDPTIARYLRERSIAVAGEIDLTTLSFFREGMAVQLGEDASITAVSKYIQAFFEGMETWRANRIARTETGAAASQAIEQTFLQNADIIDQKEWVTAGDEFVRDSHQDVDPVGVDEPFTLSSGIVTFAPGNSGDPSEDINCRCTIVAIVKQGDNNA